MTNLTSSVTGGLLSTVLGLLGVAAPPQAVQGGPEAPTGLAPSSGCDDLLRWYVDHTVRQVGPYGWHGPIMYAAASGSRLPMAAKDSVHGEAAAGSPTGTNAQEAGVDEPDVAKTDGRIVVRLVRGQLVRITDVTGERPREVGEWRLPRGMTSQELLLVGHHVVVAAEDDGVYGVLGRRTFLRAMREPAFGTDLFDLDVSDPTEPVLDQHVRWSGSSVALRQYGDTIRLVTQNQLPALHFVQPTRTRTERQAIVENRRIVRESTIEDWLPTRTEDSDESSAVDCGSVLHPSTGRVEGTILAVTLEPGSLDQASSTAVTGAGNDVYSSADRLYVWSTGRPQLLYGGPAIDLRPMTGARTTIHAFALDGEQTTYVGSGSIPGTARDRWSFDEQDGHLRVAVSYQPSAGIREPFVPETGGGIARPGSRSDNGIVVLDEQDGRLVPVGQVRGLGRGEDVQSVRWLGDLAVVVTFKQRDPLYTVDLSDVRRPRVLGALHLPGFSSYLHPIGDGRLLGLGNEVTTAGDGAKIAIFDASDPTHTLQLDHASLGAGTWFQAAQDPHAFTWLPTGDGTGLAIAEQEDAHGTEQSGFRVGSGGSLTRISLPRVGGYDVRALPLDDGRVALVGDRVAVVSP